MSGSIERAKRGLIAEWRLHALSVVSLAVAFVCLGAALLVVVNLHELKERWGRTGRASVYLRDDAPPAQVEAIVAALKVIPEVKSVRYLSPADARAVVFGQGGGDPTLRNIPQEAFPASIEIDVAPEVGEAEVQAIVGKLAALPAVEGVETYGTWTARLGSVLQGGTLAALALATIVFGAVLAVVGSTMRLALTRRRAEVEVLRLVGASSSFVKTPYVLEGTFQGAIGATAAVAVLALLFFLVKTRLDADLAGLLGLDPTFLPPLVVLGMIVTGAVLGAMGGALGLRRLTAV
ncbi:MAG: ABC transporter permease [Deltaproteobacteria bacterium]|nr:ABC transporter permease [Deltaproteobacteria bacterium]